MPCRWRVATACAEAGREQVREGPDDRLGGHEIVEHLGRVFLGHLGPDPAAVLFALDVAEDGLGIGQGPGLRADRHPIVTAGRLAGSHGGAIGLVHQPDDLGLVRGGLVQALAHEITGGQHAILERGVRIRLGQH